MPNSDGEVAMNEAHEKLRELLVAIRSVLTKYKECDFKWDRSLAVLFIFEVQDVLALYP